MGICPPGPPGIITSAADQDASPDRFESTSSFTQTLQVSVPVLENQKVYLNGFASGGGNNTSVGISSAFLNLKLNRGMSLLATARASFEEVQNEKELAWFRSESISWIDSPPPGIHVYTLELEIGINPDHPFTNIDLLSRGLNAIVFHTHE